MAKKAEQQVMQFKVTLNYITPPIWRRLLIAPDSTLGDLHRAIQGAMGWYNCHLHAFFIGDVEYGMPDPDSECEDEESVTLREVFDKPKMKVLYVYDFGDDWEHIVEFEKLVPTAPRQRYPQCIEGERACPPEDCGSYPGYERLCELMANPKLPDPEELREWIGGKYNPEKFDLKRANRAIKEIMEHGNEGW